MPDENLPGPSNRDGAHPTRKGTASAVVSDDPNNLIYQLIHQQQQQQQIMMTFLEDQQQQQQMMMQQFKALPQNNHQRAQDGVDGNTNQEGNGTFEQKPQRLSYSFKPRPNALMLRGGPNEPRWSHWVEWKSEWDDFVSLNETAFQQSDWKQRRAALRAHFSSDFKKTLEESIEGSFTPEKEGEPSIDEYMEAMEKHVKSMRNIMIDRRDFFSRRQKQGETFEEFLVDLKALSKQAESCDKCLNSTLSTLVTTT